MNTQTRTFANRPHYWIPVLGLWLALGQGALAQTFELRMAVEAVPGAKDVERGDIDRGIRRLQRALSESHVYEKSAYVKSAVATDLCAAFVMQHDFESAEPWCDRAVEESPHNGAALNNRGILRALQGAYDSAVQDLQEATKLDNYKVGTSGPSELINQGYRHASRQIAERNLAVAEERWAAAEQPRQTERVAAEQ